MSIWVAVIALTISGQQPSKLYMIDGRAYASRGLCEMAGITKIGNDASECEEIPIREKK